MPIESKHPEYKADSWLKIRDCYEGNEPIKKGRESYLTRPNGQSKDAYDAMLKRAFFLPVLARTTAETTGNIMRKSTQVEVPNAIGKLLDDVGNGKSLELLISGCVEELLLPGRRGILVDYQNNQPVLLAYNAETIVNWSDDYIVLSENYFAPDPDDKYSQVEKTQYRELTFDENGYYIQNIWQQKAKQESYSIAETITPTAMGDRFNYIPFVWMNAVDNTAAIRKPVFLDLADANIQHYQVYSDLRQVIQGTTHKATFLFSDGEKPKEVVYGLGAINHVADSQGKTEVLSDQSGLTEYLSVLDKLESQMASLGARSLQAKRKGIQSAESASIEQSGDSATLITIANSVENGIRMALEYALLFAGAKGEVKVEVNKDFVDSSVDPSMISAMLSALNTGRISQKTFLSMLQDGELLPVTIEDELEMIAEGQ